MAVIVLQDSVPLNRKRNKSFVYAARIIKNGTIKIGVSGNLQSRVIGLRSNCSSAIELIGVMPGSYPDEKRHHRKLKASRVSREIFRDTPEVQDFIKTHLMPPERFGLSIKCSQKERKRYGMVKYDVAKVNRSIDRILTAETDVRDIKICRLIQKICWKDKEECWQSFVDAFADRLGVDLNRSAKTFETYRIEDRKVHYLDSLSDAGVK